MHADEKAIIDYLKGWPNSFVSGKEIARKVGGRERFDDDRGWALPILVQMVRHGILETDHLGCYKLKLEEKKNRNKKHVSPQMLKILKSCGRSFDGVVLDDGLNEPPIPVYRKPSPPPGKKPEQSEQPGQPPESDSSTPVPDHAWGKVK
jgi:hypothetical protein